MRIAIIAALAVLLVGCETGGRRVPTDCGGVCTTRPDTGQ